EWPRPYGVADAADPRRRGDRVRRRDFISLLGSAAAAWPLAARAQQGERARRIGVLAYWAADDAEGRARLEAFTQALQQLGWSEGRNLRIETRATANADELRRHAADPGAAGRQCDRVHDLRIQHERKMVGTAQGDRAWRDAGSGASRSDGRLRD